MAATNRARAETDPDELDVGRYRAVVESAEDAIYAVDVDDRIRTWNQAAERMYGYSSAQILGQPRATIVPDDRRGEIRTILASVLAGTPLERIETQRRRRDGTIFDVQITVSPVRDGAGLIVGASTIARDISELRRAEALFRGAFEHAPIGVALCTVTVREPVAVVVRCNHALDDLLGYPRGALLGTSIAALAHNEDGGRFEDACKRLLRGVVQRVRVEQRLRHAEGHFVWTLVSASLVHGGAGDEPQAIVQLLDISERKSFEGRLQHLADHDALTGLHNRRRFEIDLRRALAHSERYGGRGAVMLLDLDGFKDINDMLGHSVGDELIARVAGVLRAQLRTTDSLARVGGDEFAVILPQANEVEALAVADKLLGAVRRQGSVTTLQQRARVTTSIGVTLYGPEAGLTGDDLLAEADIAMYDVKDAGHDGVKVFRSEERRRERVTARAVWLERLRVALESDSFTLLAQPIRGLASNGVPWYELLLRLEDDSGELIAPGSFLYLAERFDLIVDIDRWVLGRAVRLLHTAHERARPLRLAVNLSPKSLAHPTIGDHIAELLAAYPIADGSLVVEVTETAAIVNIDHARAFAERLHELGCRFALDDFGAGFASFYYLKHLAFDYLKIDGEFVRQLVDNRTDQLVIEAVVNIARGLHTQTVAEFVGDDETCALLLALGVDYGQGFHLGRPAPLAEVVPDLHV